MNPILNWLQTYFRLIAFRGDEALISCPACSKDKLYFNVIKKIGTCHYAGCRFHSEPVTIKKLTNICGFAPDESVNFSIPITSVSAIPLPVNMPKEAYPLITRSNGQLFTCYPRVVSEIQQRMITVEKMFRYNFHFDGLRVYIPIYYEGQMVQWVGRAAWWFAHEEKKYQYATGAPVTNYLFNWDINKYATRLSLVENTFVAIALDAVSKEISGKQYGWCSAFGSNLSSHQCSLIGRSNADTVLVVFDSDAQDKATKGVQKLRGLGIRAGVLSLYLKQPDDYSLGVLARATHEIHDILKGSSGQWAFRFNSEGILETI